MSDQWQELRDEVARLESTHKRLTEENPKLEKRNVLLKKEVEHHNKMIVDAQSTLGQIKDDADKLKVAADTYVAEVKESANDYKIKVIAEVDKRTAQLDIREFQLDQREATLVEREQVCTEAEKSNVAQSQALDELGKQLESQATEIQDATKALNIKATDNRHDADANEARSQQLDKRESDIVVAEANATDLTKQAQHDRMKAREIKANAQDVVAMNASRSIDLDKREAFLKKREDDVTKREKHLNDRARLQKMANL